MEFTIGLILGAIIGVGVYFLTHQPPQPSGTFIMDFSNPDEDGFCKLVMDEDLNSIYTKKEIILRIDAKDFNSPE